MIDGDSLPPIAPSGASGPGADDLPEDNLAGVLTRLVKTGRAYAEAEIDRQKLRAGILASGLRTVAILAVVALILMFGTLVTLMVGLVVALSPLLTPLGATLAVALGGLALVVLLLLIARTHLRSVLRKIAE
jgi:uncharacterized membrane protein